MATQRLNSYADVRAFLNEFIEANLIGIDGAPHGAYWNDLSYDEFVNGNVPGVAGPVKNLISGNAANSNLIKILKAPLTIGGQTLPRMPQGGPFMSAEMIASLADWIDRHCPNP